VGHWKVAVIAAASAAGIATVQAELTRAQLAGQASNVAVRLDPLGTASGALALLLTIGVYWLLGRAIARGGGTTGAAMAAGAVAGLVAGLLGGLAQAHGVEGYLSRALGRVYLPPWFLSAALGLYALLLTVLGTLVGAASAWFGARAARRGDERRTP